MLNNEKFVSKAPAAKIQEEKDKLAKYEQMMATVQERLAQDEIATKVKRQVLSIRRSFCGENFLWKQDNLLKKISTILYFEKSGDKNDL